MSMSMETVESYLRNDCLTNKKYLDKAVKCNDTELLKIITLFFLFL